MADKSNIREVIEKGVKELMKEAQVPQHVHLRVVKKLREALDNHKADIAEYKDVYKQHKEDLSRHEERDNQHEEHLKALIEELNRAKLHDWTGAEGKPGRDAKEVDIPALVSQIIALIPQPKDGKDGKDGINGKDAETPDEEKLVNKFIQRVQKGDVIHINHVRGAAAFIKDGVKYKTEELMHGSGSLGKAIFNEIVAGSGTSFTLANVPKLGTVNLFGNGQRLTPGISNDYTISGTVITPTNSFSSGAILADYYY